MAINPPGLPGEGSTRDGAPAAQASEQGHAASERYGPIAIERLVKDDGRALLLFSHAPGDEPAGRGHGDELAGRAPGAALAQDG
jgi:hypothetical protein